MIAFGVCFFEVPVDAYEKSLKNDIAKIVKETAQECNLPYYEYKTMRSAVIAHFKHLKTLGMKPELT